MAIRLKIMNIDEDIEKLEFLCTAGMAFFEGIYIPQRHSSEEWLYIYIYAAKSLQSCPTLCDTIDGSPPGSPVPGILKARTLEWVAISFSNA